MCNCQFCQARRSQQLRDDLNAMYDRPIQPPADSEWHPNPKWTAIAIAAACFIWGLGYEAVKHSLWLILK